jgi:NAD(P)H-dependent flavin oxidoreductase YrpB (nitropropane dioxygenase family)
MAISTPLTQLLNIQHPILLAGMDQTSDAPLVAAVSNAGGMGVLGGVNYTPQMLREMIKETKVYFHLFYNIGFNALIGF